MTGEPVLVAVVADGAGSAAYAEIGAQSACSLLIEEIEALMDGEKSVRDLTREFAEGWVVRLQKQIAARAEAEALRPRDFACTTLAAVVGPDCAAFLQIGDGAIVVAAEEAADEYGWVFWPQQGEYENVTCFVTEPAAPERLEHALVEGRIGEIALFTDGLQRLALQFATREAHAPFFRPMFAPVRAADGGYSETLSSALARYLDLPQVNHRTDDDKTLVLATRRHDTGTGDGDDGP
jgi:hypothetical protein